MARKLRKVALGVVWSFNGRLAYVASQKNIFAGENLKNIVVLGS